jgi:hypothetical protein
MCLLLGLKDLKAHKDLLEKKATQELTAKTAKMVSKYQQELTDL